MEGNRPLETRTSRWICLQREGSSKKAREGFQERVVKGTEKPIQKPDDDDDIDESAAPDVWGYLKGIHKHLETLNDRHSRVVAEKSAESEKFQRLYEKQVEEHAKKETSLALPTRS